MILRDINKLRIIVAKAGKRMQMLYKLKEQEFGNNLLVTTLGIYM